MSASSDFDDGLRLPAEPAALELCESPIERRFLRAFLAYAPGIDIRPQVVIGPWRADFVIADQVIAECDGEEFHYATDEQRRRDIDRDGEMSKLGYATFRFCGSEINTDVLSCCRKVMMAIEGIAA